VDQNAALLIRDQHATVQRTVPRPTTVPQKKNPVYQSQVRIKIRIAPIQELFLFRTQEWRIDNNPEYTYWYSIMDMVIR
jgi:hypothetical protein